MRASQTLNLEASEKRGELADVTGRLNKAAADGTEPSVEDIGKADTITREIRSIEVRYRASVLEEEEADRIATAKGDFPDMETREHHDIRVRSRFGRYCEAAMEMRSVDGAEAELNAVLKIGGNRFPLEMLAPSEAQLRRLEKRQTSDTDTAVVPRRWLDRLFAGTAADRLGITFESVAPGGASFPVTTAGMTPAQRGRSEAAAAGAWTVGVTELKPTRNAVHAIFSTEDAARLPGLEDALVRDMRMGLVERVDRSIFKGDSGANEDPGDITGLQSAAITEVTLTQAAKIKAPDTIQKFVGLVDGKHAESLADLRVVASVGANTLWVGTIANSAASNETIGQFMRASGLSWTARGEIETATAAGDFGAYIGLGRGIEGAGVAAVWSAGELIRDPYTGATKGEVGLTIGYLWALGFPRTSSFKRLKFVA